MPKPYDPYSSDSAYMRFGLVRMALSKMPKAKSINEATELLESLAAFVAKGSAVEEDGEMTEGPDEGAAVTLVPAGGYL